MLLWALIDPRSGALKGINDVSPNFLWWLYRDVVPSGRFYKCLVRDTSWRKRVALPWLYTSKRLASRAFLISRMIKNWLPLLPDIVALFISRLIMASSRRLLSGSTCSARLWSSSQVWHNSAELHTSLNECRNLRALGSNKSWQTGHGALVRSLDALDLLCAGHSLRILQEIHPMLGANFRSSRRQFSSNSGPFGRKALSHSGHKASSEGDTIFDIWTGCEKAFRNKFEGKSEVGNSHCFINSLTVGSCQDFYWWARHCHRHVERAGANKIQPRHDTWHNSDYIINTLSN